MTANEGGNSVLDTAALENARIGYQAAINLWIYEGNVIWSRFAAMVSANTIVIATIGIIITSSTSKNRLLLKLGLCAMGLVLCVTWAVLMRRGFQYFRFWLLSARELEDQYLGNSLSMLARVPRFADGEEIVFNSSTIKPYKAKHSIMRAESMAYLVIIAFALMYVLILASG
ncbi:MAG: hypothetical protein IPG76_06680 [Acidobacteria bacterium]|nr:hypothetical protein [Acidobacteriota bacterium]